MEESMEVKILDQNERMKRFGLECLGPKGDGILFKAGTWRPGGEYVQKLVIRNVSTTVKKLKYKLPSTRFFSLAYPEVIILSPGMFKEVDVIFRPVELNPYDDTIYIRMQEGPGSGGFHVPVRATIDRLVISCPFGIDLGYCPTFQTTALYFQLTNVGEVDAPFRWEQSSPFVLEPAEGVIPVGQVRDIRVSIVASDASVFVAQAVCHVGEGVHAIIPEPMISTRISAIGKYAYIALSESEVDFGEVLSGTKSPKSLVQKEVVLRNNSVVPAEFELIRHESDVDEVFDITPKQGTIPPQSEIPIVIRYSGLAVGNFSLDRYTFRTPGDCKTCLTCKGTSMPSHISINKESSSGVNAAGGDAASSSLQVWQQEVGTPLNSFNFRDVNIGKTETRILYLKNDSAKDVLFSIATGEEGIFKVFPRQGTIPALMQAFPVSLSFCPPQPINYYRRVFVLIGDALPLFYDVMGSGYIRAKGEVKEQRPAPLRHAHIQAYRNRSVQGLGGLSPDELDEMYESRTGDPLFFAQVGFAGTRAMSLTTLQNPLTRTGETTRVTVAAAHEFFVNDTDATCREVVIDKTCLDFGFTPFQSSSDSKSISITNNTNGKLSVAWQIPRAFSDDKDKGNAETTSAQAFDIEPAAVDINAGKTQTFRITFRPKQSNRNFVAALEAFVYFKNQRTFRLVNDSTLTPPWYLSLCVMGHTFATGQLLAKVKLTNSNIRSGKLIFPCCYEGEATYQTVVLHNTSNLPSTFRFEFGFEEGGGDASDNVFAVKPLHGEVSAEDFVLVYIRFTPKASRKCVQLLHCIVNGEKGGKLLLEGTGAIPFLCIPEFAPTAKARGDIERGIASPPHQIPRGVQGSFYMKPTCVGLSSSRTFTMKNGSRLPLRFRLFLPSEADDIVSVHPMRGLLRGNETISLTITFAPQHATVYNFKLRAKTLPVGGRPQQVVDAHQPMSVLQSEVLQTLSVVIVAPGEIGAIIFDPPRLNTDVRLVNTTEKRDIFLENVSDSDLFYQLFYREEFVGDSGSVLQTRSVSETRSLLNIQDDRIEEAHCLFCEAPTGILAARSRTRVPFTFRPLKAGLFEFLIFCKLQAIGEEEGGTMRQRRMLPNEETAFLRTSRNENTSFRQGGGGFLASYPLKASITSRATFPKLTVEDIRIEDSSLVADVELLWRLFSLQSLNYDLSLPLTDAECKFNASASPNLSKLKRYRFEFTPAVVGSPLQTVHLQLRNNGFLPTSFHLHLPNEKELELESWCDEDEPSEELNKIICIIEELKCFVITPRVAVLLPGESCTLTISYSHAFLKYGGVHNLPIHVKLDQGKQFFLDLVGRTLPPPFYEAPTSRGSSVSQALSLTNSAALPPTDLLLTTCVGKDGVYFLSAVPCGLSPSEAPRQRMELINVSAVDAAYELEFASLDALVDTNFGSPIVRVSNPSGLVAARSSIFIDWYFYPLEAKMYEFPVTIRYLAVESRQSNAKAIDGSVFVSAAASKASSNNNRKAQRNGGGKELSKIQMSVRVLGYDPREEKPFPFGAEFVGGCAPNEQLISLPNHLASLSTDMVDLLTVPQNGSASRLVIVQNRQASATIEFSVEEDCELIKEGLLVVSPKSGKLAPGEQMVVDFSFLACGKPMLIQDRVKLIVREVVKGATRRRGAVPNKALDSVSNKKANTTTEHESVIKRTTAARTAQLESVVLANGRTRSLPTTVNANGVVISSTTANNIGSEKLSFQATTLGAITEPSLTSSNASDVKGAAMAIANSADTESIGSRSRSGGPMSGNQTSDPNLSPTSRQGAGPGSASSSRRSRQGRGEETPSLLGLSSVLLVRVRGQVLPVETSHSLFRRSMQSQNILKEVILPPVPPFIAPLTSATFSLAPASDSPSHREPKAAKVLDMIIEAKRHKEMRNISDAVVSSLFRTLLEASSVNAYVEQTERDVSQSLVRLRDNEEGSPSKRSFPYGVHFNEIDANINKRALSSSSTLSGNVKPHFALAMYDEAFAVQDSASRGSARNASLLIANESETTSFERSELVQLGADVLVNTMFNLVQEAVFSEFPIQAEFPTRFVVKS